jgi:hypothetical protein
VPLTLLEHFMQMFIDTQHGILALLMEETFLLHTLFLISVKFRRDSYEIHAFMPYTRRFYQLVITGVGGGGMCNLHMARMTIRVHFHAQCGHSFFWTF